MKFSIITVCLNSVKTIEQTILSVTEQRYPYVEYIVIDGGSTDGTLDIIKKYADKIHYWVSEPDFGIYDAMNKGIKKVTGDVIAFLNADDWYEADILSIISRYFQHNDVDMIGGCIQYIYNGSIMGKTASKYDLKKIYINSGCPHQALFARKAVFNKIGVFHTQYRLSADYEWILRAWAARTSFCSIPDVCTNFRIGGISTDRCYDGYCEVYEAARKVLGEEYYDEIEKYYEGDNRLEKYFYEQEFLGFISETNINLLKEYLPDSVYYIWGTGNQGGRCLSILEMTDLEIMGLVDNDKIKWGTRIGRYKVFSPKELDRKIKICIATRQYDDDIKQQLKEMGYADNEYIVFSDIMKDIVMKQTGLVYSK